MTTDQWLSLIAMILNLGVVIICIRNLRYINKRIKEAKDRIAQIDAEIERRKAGGRGTL